MFELDCSIELDLDRISYDLDLEMRSCDRERCSSRLSGDFDFACVPRDFDAFTTSGDLLPEPS